MFRKEADIGVVHGRLQFVPTEQGTVPCIIGYDVYSVYNIDAGIDIVLIDDGADAKNIELSGDARNQALNLIENCPDWQEYVANLRESVQEMHAVDAAKWRKEQ